MAPNVLCNYCDKHFKTTFSLKRHMRNVHNISIKKDMRGSFCCPICEEHLYKFSDFTQHSLNKHDISITCEQIEFKNHDEFLVWKHITEKNTKTCFVKKSADRLKVRTESKTANFYCNRSGFFNPKPKDNERKREVKIQGSCKINGFCPCSIKATYFDDGKITINYCSTHIGHTTDLAHLPLKQVERQSVAIQMVNQIPFDCILENVRSTVGTKDIDRIHLLTKQDLYNIETEFRLNCDTVRHSIGDNDAVSVDAWAKEEMLSENNCVLIYKPQHEIVKYSLLKKEDFALGIMTPAQREILKKFGNDCICIDSTYGLNAHDFEVVTLMVLDDLRQGFPCAFFICNRIDRETICQFLSVIKQQVGILQTTIFMSDMAESFYNAWIDVMGPVQHQLYCTWHVDRAWQNNLKKIKNKEKQTETYKKVRTLLVEMNEDAFLTMLDPVIHSICNDEDTTEFGHYFKDRYGSCFKQWAHCFRKNCGINTDMHLERMHRTIKHLYFKGKTVKRLDKAIHAIMQFTKQKLFDRLTVLEKGKVTTKIKELRSRHTLSLKLSTDSIVSNNDSSWEIASSSNNQVYTVRLVEPNCDCHIVCVQCSSCLHKYSCTCIDACIKWNMCKHIHLLCRMLKSLEATNAQTNSNNVEESRLFIDEMKGFGEKQVILKQVGLKETAKLELLKSDLIEKFQKTINNITSLEEIRQGEQTFKILETNLTSLKSSVELPKVRLSGDKNIQPQRRFLSLNKQTNNINHTKRSSNEEKQCIAMESLLTLHLSHDSKHTPG